MTGDIRDLRAHGQAKGEYMYLTGARMIPGASNYEHHLSSGHTTTVESPWLYEDIPKAEAENAWGKGREDMEDANQGVVCQWVGRLCWFDSAIFRLGGARVGPAPHTYCRSSASCSL